MTRKTTRYFKRRKYQNLWTNNKVKGDYKCSLFFETQYRSSKSVILCDLCAWRRDQKRKKERQRKKPVSGKLGIRRVDRDYSRRRIEIKFCVFRYFQGSNLITITIGFQVWEVEFALSIALAIGLQHVYTRYKPWCSRSKVVISITHSHDSAKVQYSKDNYPWHPPHKSLSQSSPKFALVITSVYLQCCKILSRSDTQARAS